MTTQEVANKLVSFCKQRQFSEAIEELYSNDMVRIEPKGSSAEETKGLAAVIRKTEQFNNMVGEIHEMEISAPLVADKFFSFNGDGCDF